MQIKRKDKKISPPFVLNSDKAGVYFIYRRTIENGMEEEMKYQAYLFDFDYTLANSEKGILGCFRYVLQKYQYQGISDEEIKKTIGMTLKDAFRKLTKVEDEDIISEYQTVYRKKADEIMNKNTVIFPSVPEVLKTLSKNGKNVMIVSTKGRERIEEFFDIVGLKQEIDFILGGEDVKKEKPNPEGILTVIERFGLQREDVLYIGDSVIDAQAAQKAGVDFVGVTSGVTTTEELEQFSHVMILKDIKGVLEI